MNTLIAIIALLIAVVDITFRVKKHNEDKKSRPVVEKKVIYLAKDEPPLSEPKILNKKEPPNRPPSPNSNECPYCHRGTIRIDNTAATSSYKLYTCGTAIRKASTSNSIERSRECTDNERKFINQSSH